MSQFLILHKVRGQPAFDIAERCEDMGTEDDPGPWWIIPTSGHRAYPRQAYPIASEAISFANTCGEDPYWADLPDHYQVALIPRKVKSTEREEWEMLKEFMGPQSTIARRFG